MSRRPERIIIILALIGVSSIPLPAAALIPVAVEGKPVGALSGDHYGRILGFHLNNAGLASLSTSITRPSPSSEFQAFLAGNPANLQLFAAVGAQAPGMPPGTTFADIFAHDLTNDGRVLFVANLQGPLVTDLNRAGIWEGPINAPAIIVRNGDPAPGLPGAIYDGGFDYYFFATIESGRIVYTSHASGPGIDAVGLWEGPLNSPSLFFRSGQQAPGQPDGTIFSNLRSARSSLLGQISFEAELTGPGMVNANSTWAGPPSAPRLVYRAGLAAPGTPDGVVFTDSFGGHTQVNDLGHILVTSSLSGPGVDNSNEFGLWVGGAGSLQLVARGGSHAPGTADNVNFYGSRISLPNGAYSGPFYQYRLNNRSDIAFYTYLTGDEVTQDNYQGIWLGRAGAVNLLARTGGQVPGAAPGVTFYTFSFPSVQFLLNDLGQVAFIAGASGPGFSDYGVWATDTAGNLRFILGARDAIDLGGGDQRRITNLYLTSFNSNNQIGLILGFSDGTNGAFIATVPEPSSLILIGMTPMLLRARRRKCDLSKANF